jgi:toxin-antitoxin system PIN domain toxin
MTTLLDSDVLIALAVTGHVHHSRARRWLGQLDDSIATCPITQGSLVRFLIRNDRKASTAQAMLSTITALDSHVFWPDDVPFQQVTLLGVVGHRQVTDAYLAQLARENSGRLATLDGGLAALHRDIAYLID